MSQTIFTSINPNTTSGTQLATILNNFKDAVVSGFSGTSRPSALQAGGYWVDLTNDPTSWDLKIWTGTIDITMFTLDLANGTATVSASSNLIQIIKSSDDALGAVLKLLKIRPTGNQVKIGDVLGEVDFYGTRDDAVATLQASIQSISSNDVTATNSGAYIVFKATNTGASTASEMMRLIDSKLGIGVTSPDETLHVKGTGSKLERSADDTTGVKLQLKKKRVSGGGAVLSGDNISTEKHTSFTSSSADADVVQIEVDALENHTSSAQGTSWKLKTKKTGQSSFTTRIDVQSATVDIPDLKVGTVTNTEIGYLSGVTSPIQTQFTGKQSTSEKNAANGYCGLDSGGKVAAAQLPAYVDDILEYANFASLPVTGSSGIIYVTLDTNKIYRWSGSAYVEVESSLADTLLTTNAFTLGTDRHFVNTIAADSTTTGSNASLASFTAGIVRLTNASLVSLANIPAGTGGQILWLLNRTGVDVVVFDSIDAIGTAANRIYTGTKAQITWADQSSLQLVYDGTASRWSIVGGTGSGTGSGASLSTISQLIGTEQLTAWSSGNNASFMGGGSLAATFAKETSSPLHGLASYKLTQASGSLNDYIASALQVVDIKFRGNFAYLSYPAKYDGNASDILAVVYDVTNSTILSSTTDFVIPTGTGPAVVNVVGVFIPTTCTQIRLGFQVKVANSGKILSFDDVEFGSNISSLTSIKTLDVSEARLNTSSARGSTDTGIAYYTTTQTITGGGLRIDTDSTLGTRITVLKDGTLYTCATLNQGGTFQITKNQATRTTISSTASEILAASGTSTVDAIYGQMKVSANDVIRVSANTNPSANAANSFSCILLSQADAIVSQVQQVSSDTVAFTFKSTVIDPNTDPIGTFNTYTSVSGYVPVIATSAPTQTISDMNANGFLLYGKAGNGTSTAAQPARVDIFIGKGLKNVNVDAYAATGKTTPFYYDFVSSGSSSTAEGGIRKIYDATTGILVLEAMSQSAFDGSTTTSRNMGQKVDGNSVAGASGGYFVFNASRTPSLVTLPIMFLKSAFLQDVKSSGTDGGTSTSGAFNTRTLNTLTDPYGLVTSLSSNQFTLPAGTYNIFGHVQGFGTDRVRAKIRNITDSTDAVLSISDYSNNTSTATAKTHLEGEITIASPKVFELQQRVTTGVSTNGLGLAASFSINEIYAQLKITKIK